jgi:hypothetical protein
MNAEFHHNGRVHTFQVSLGARPDGRIGPPIEVIIDDPAPPGYAGKRKLTSWRVAYDHVDAKHDRLIYRVVEAL